MYGPLIFFAITCEEMATPALKYMPDVRPKAELWSATDYLPADYKLPELNTCARFVGAASLFVVAGGLHAGGCALAGPCVRARARLLVHAHAATPRVRRRLLPPSLPPTRSENEPNAVDEPQEPLAGSIPLPPFTLPAFLPSSGVQKGGGQLGTIPRFPKTPFELPIGDVPTAEQLGTFSWDLEGRMELLRKNIELRMQGVDPYAKSHEEWANFFQSLFVPFCNPGACTCT